MNTSAEISIGRRVVFAGLHGDLAMYNSMTGIIVQLHDNGTADVLVDASMMGFDEDCLGGERYNRVPGVPRANLIPVDMVESPALAIAEEASTTRKRVPENVPVQAFTFPPKEIRFLPVPSPGFNGDPPAVSRTSPRREKKDKVDETQPVPTPVRIMQRPRQPPVEPVSVAPHCPPPAGPAKCTSPPAPAGPLKSTKGVFVYTDGGLEAKPTKGVFMYNDGGLEAVDLGEFFLNGSDPLKNVKGQEKLEKEQLEKQKKDQDAAVARRNGSRPQGNDAAMDGKANDLPIIKVMQRTKEPVVPQGVNLTCQPIKQPGDAPSAAADERAPSSSSSSKPSSDSSQLDAKENWHLDSAKLKSSFVATREISTDISSSASTYDLSSVAEEAASSDGDKSSQPSVTVEDGVQKQKVCSKNDSPKNDAEQQSLNATLSGSSNEVHLDSTDLSSTVPAATERALKSQSRWADTSEKEIRREAKKERRAREIEEREKEKLEQTTAANARKVDSECATKVDSESAKKSSAKQKAKQPAPPAPKQPAQPVQPEQTAQLTQVQGKKKEFGKKSKPAAKDKGVGQKIKIRINAALKRLKSRFQSPSSGGSTVTVVMLLKMSLWGVVFGLLWAFYLVVTGRSRVGTMSTIVLEKGVLPLTWGFTETFPRSQPCLDIESGPIRIGPGPLASAQKWVKRVAIQLIEEGNLDCEDPPICDSSDTVSQCMLNLNLLLAKLRAASKLAAETSHEPKHKNVVAPTVAPSSSRSETRSRPSEKKADPLFDRDRKSIFARGCKYWNEVYSGRENRTSSSRISEADATAGYKLVTHSMPFQKYLPTDEMCGMFGIIRMTEEPTLVVHFKFKSNATYVFLPEYTPECVPSVEFAARRLKDLFGDSLEHVEVMQPKKADLIALPAGTGILGSTENVTESWLVIGPDLIDMMQLHPNVKTNVMEQESLASLTLISDTVSGPQCSLHGLQGKSTITGQCEPFLLSTFPCD